MTSFAHNKANVKCEICYYIIVCRVCMFVIEIRVYFRLNNVCCERSYYSKKRKWRSSLCARIISYNSHCLVLLFVCSVVRCCAARDMYRIVLYVLVYNIYDIVVVVVVVSIFPEPNRIHASTLFPDIHRNSKIDNRMVGLRHRVLKVFLKSVALRISSGIVVVYHKQYIWYV